MKKQIVLALCAALSTSAWSQTNKAKEIELIKSMAGMYKVDFKFTETFAPNKDYKYGDKKFEWANEYVTIVEETPNKISLQHLLIISDSMVIKHWRQDWVYEAAEYFTYEKDMRSHDRKSRNSACYAQHKTTVQEVNCAYLFGV